MQMVMNDSYMSLTWFIFHIIDLLYIHIIGLEWCFSNMIEPSCHLAAYKGGKDNYKPGKWTQETLLLPFKSSDKVEEVIKVSW